MRCLLAPVALAMLAAFPAAATATWPGKPSRIVYYALDDADEGRRDGIYSSRADGSRRQRIVRRAVDGVATSRDGKLIAWFRTNGELWRARSDGSHPRLVVSLQDGVGSDAAWSPSADRLVFTIAFDGDKYEVWVVRSDGEGLRKLAAGYGPTWSSRGLIAFLEEDADLATIRPNGRDRRIRVPQGRPANVYGLDFSPDGRRLVYQQSTRRFGNPTIRTFNLRTRKRTSFRDQTKTVSARAVVWAPGGRHLDYVHTGGGGSGPTQLRRIRPDGTGRRTLFGFPSGLTPFDFAWQTR